MALDVGATARDVRDAVLAYRTAFFDMHLDKVFLLDNMGTDVVSPELDLARKLGVKYVHWFVRGHAGRELIPQRPDTSKQILLADASSVVAERLERFLSEQLAAGREIEVRSRRHGTVRVASLSLRSATPDQSLYPSVAFFLSKEKDSGVGSFVVAPSDEGRAHVWVSATTTEGLTVNIDPTIEQFGGGLKTAPPDSGLRVRAATVAPYVWFGEDLMESGVVFADAPVECTYTNRLSDDAGVNVALDECFAKLCVPRAEEM